MKSLTLILICFHLFSIALGMSASYIPRMDVGLNPDRSGSVSHSNFEKVKRFGLNCKFHISSYDPKQGKGDLLLLPFVSVLCLPKILKQHCGGRERGMEK